MKKIFLILVPVLLSISFLKGQYVFYGREQIYGIPHLENNIPNSIFCRYELQDTLVDKKKKKLLLIEYQNDKNIPIMMLLPSKNKVKSIFKYTYFLPLPKRGRMQELTFYNYLYIGDELGVAGEDIDKLQSYEAKGCFKKLNPHEKLTVKVFISKRHAKLLKEKRKFLTAYFVILPIYKDVPLPYLFEKKNTFEFINNSCIYCKKSNKGTQKLFSNYSQKKICTTNIYNSPFELRLKVTAKK